MLIDKSALTQGSSISNNYKLNVGDRVKIYFWGETFDFMSMVGGNSLEPLISSVVDREGNLFVPNVGVIYAKGKNYYRDRKRKFTRLYLKSYTNFEVKNYR